MASAGGSVNTSKNKSKQQNSSRTVFPGAFLEDFGGAFGRGVSLEELLAGLPRSTGLFGGGQVGILPTGNVAPPQDLPYAPNTTTPREYWNAQQRNDRYANTQGAQGAYAAQQGGAPGAINTGPDSLRGFPGATLASQGQPGADFRPGTRPDVQAAGGAANSQVANTFQEPSFLDPNAPVGPRFAASGSNLGGLDVQGNLQRLGFFDTPPDYRGAPELNIRNLPNITAPEVQAAQMNIGAGDLSRFEDSIYRSQFDPVRRELERTGTLDDRRLQAELAQAGLASSGSGIGQVAQQRRDRAQQIEAASSDAAQRAAAQRYGYQFSQEETNAQLNQQARLANAGFNMQAQTENANNILRGDTARSETYLRTLGLNQQAGQALRSDFLNVMNLAEQDLQRMDNFQLQTLGVLLNNWLQQGSLVGQIGRESEGRGTASGSSFGISGQASVG